MTAERSDRMSERWKPEYGEYYYYSFATGAINKTVCINDPTDIILLERGNCFKTKEAAEAAAEKVKALLLSLQGNGETLQADIQGMVKDTCQAMDKGRENVAKATCSFGNLPKLTTDVFDRPDCPKWAKWAAVDESGRAYWYASLPKNEIYSLTRQCVWHNGSKNFEIIPGKFDASKWERSLIERPVTLPDWCKVGEWGYDTEEACYFEIVGVTPFNVDVAYTGKEWRYNIGRGVFDDNYKPARLRSYNSEEMQLLVGKVIKHNKSGDRELVLSFHADDNSVETKSWLMWGHTLLSYYTINGSRCGVFEHLDNGEWVR